MLDSKEQFDVESEFNGLHFICQEYASEIANIYELHKKTDPQVQPVLKPHQSYNQVMAPFLKLF